MLVCLLPSSTELNRKQESVEDELPDVTYVQVRAVIHGLLSFELNLHCLYRQFKML